MTSLDVTDSVLTAREVSKSFQGQRVLQSISLQVRAHEVVAIVGPSGGGKSTFLRCLNLLERPDAGDVLLGSISLLRANKRELPGIRAHIGMVFQSFNLFPHLSAAENIALAPRRVLGIPPEEAKDRAVALLARVGLADKIASYPRQLSGGQQQRVAIARALAMDPAVMLFDEPTSALDAENVHEVIQTMRELSETGMTMIVVSHEPGFVREAANRVLFVDGGVIVEEANPHQFFRAPRSERARAFVSKIL